MLGAEWVLITRQKMNKGAVRLIDVDTGDLDGCPDGAQPMCRYRPLVYPRDGYLSDSFN